MKNIHIIPTDKPSRLQLNVNTKKLILFDNIQSNNESAHLTTQHIYITNDEEIKEGDKWIYNIHWNEPSKIEEDWLLKLLNESSNILKIIATSDLDLINDGVQPIDDEFLKWFVKNPSCEEVKVEIDYSKSVMNYSYKIIIPKEEPKQETLEGAALNYADGNGWNTLTIESFKEGAKWMQERMYSEENVFQFFEKYREDFPIHRNIQILDSQFKDWFEQFKKK